MAAVDARPHLPLSESFLHDLSDDESLELPAFNYNYDSDGDGEPSPPTTVEPVTAPLVSPAIAATSAALGKYRATLANAPEDLPRRSPPSWGKESGRTYERRISEEHPPQRVTAASSSVIGTGRVTSVEVEEIRPYSLRHKGHLSASAQTREVNGLGISGGNEAPGPSLTRATTLPSHTHETPSSRGFLSSSFRSAARQPRLLGGKALRVPASALATLDDTPPPPSPPAASGSGSRRSSPRASTESSPPPPYSSQPDRSPPATISRPGLTHRPRSRTSDTRSDGRRRSHESDEPPPPVPPLPTLSRTSPTATSLVREYRAEATASPDPGDGYYADRSVGRSSLEARSRYDPASSSAAASQTLSRARARSSIETTAAASANRRVSPETFQARYAAQLQSQKTPSPEALPLEREYARLPDRHARHESAPVASTTTSAGVGRHRPAVAFADISPESAGSGSGAHPSPTLTSENDKENPRPLWRLGYSPPLDQNGLAKRGQRSSKEGKVEPREQQATEADRDRDREWERDYPPPLREIGNTEARREARTITRGPPVQQGQPQGLPHRRDSGGALPPTATIRASHMAAAAPAPRELLSPAPAQAQVPAHVVPPPAPTPSVPSTYHVNHEEQQPQVRRGQTFWVNKVPYTRLDVLGRGGSSKVYRVLSPDSKIYALKKVTLDRADDETLNSYQNEIALLNRLNGNDRIIRLVDSESSRKKGSLVMVLECGEIDMAKLLEERRGMRLQFQWVETYWQQMLEAVQVIHEAAIVHSDLKPANFVLVRGSLKLIDFGIAKAIPNDTTNIQRDAQIGTVNYMSPEAIEDTNQNNGESKRCMKLGRPSDVWSLGCILYQMIYGAPPFHHLSTFQKMRAIPDPNHIIEFPAAAVPSVRGAQGLVEVKTEDAVVIPPEVLDVLKSCLQRNPKARRAIPEILASQWLTTWQRSASSGAAVATVPSNGMVLQPDEVVMTASYLEEVLRSSCRFGADHGMCSDETIKQWRARIVNALTDDRTA